MIRSLLLPLTLLILLSACTQKTEYSDSARPRQGWDLP